MLRFWSAGWWFAIMVVGLWDVLNVALKFC